MDILHDLPKKRFTYGDLWFTTKKNVKNGLEENLGNWALFLGNVYNQFFGSQNMLILKI